MKSLYIPKNLYDKKKLTKITEYSFNVWRQKDEVLD